MRKTFTHLAQQIKSKVQATGTYRGTPDDLDVADWLDWGLELIGQYTYPFDPMISWTPQADTRIYDLQDTDVFGKKIVRPLDVTYNGVLLTNLAGDRRSGITYMELSEFLPSYQTTPSGTPTRWAFVGNNKLVLTPPMASSESPTNNFVSGRYIPGAILSDGTYEPDGFSEAYTDGGSVPDVPDILVPVLVDLAVMMATDPVVSGADAWQRTMKMHTQAQRHIQMVASQNKNAMSPLHGTIQRRRWV